MLPVEAFSLKKTVRTKIGKLNVLRIKLDNRGDAKVNAIRYPPGSEQRTDGLTSEWMDSLLCSMSKEDDISDTVTAARQVSFAMQDAVINTPE